MSFKNYQSIKIKFHLKNNHLLLFSNGLNQTYINWIKIEQNLKNLKLNYYKIYNKIATKIFKNSIFLNFYPIIKGPFFFLKIDLNLKKLNKSILFSDALKSLFFNLISIKLNNKIYSILQIKNILSLTYKTNIAILYQFLLINLKQFFFYNK